MKIAVLSPISKGLDLSDFLVAPGVYLSNPIFLTLEFLGTPLPLRQGHLQELGIYEGALISFGLIHVHLEVGLMPVSLGPPDVTFDTLYCDHGRVLNGSYPHIGHISKIVLPPIWRFFQCFCKGLGNGVGFRSAASPSKVPGRRGRKLRNP
jgi:hypothetical protein